jgi:hypothetical protein
MVDEKKERFIRIAERRTNNILEQLRLLGNCSNKNNYSYTEEDVKKIFLVIEAELKMVKMKFNSKANKEKFKL